MRKFTFGSLCLLGVLLLTASCDVAAYGKVYYRRGSVTKKGVVRRGTVVKRFK
ncbi:MAG: hypothetical protein LBL71_00770 [Endomicrobium sp.]|jgi:hypothetical protein|nr:hypothetical protein [Endomicrobium sp.]